MTDFNTILEPDNFYHIYNRANGKDILFKNKNNYTYFLSKYKHYILPVSDLFCYCLMPNHFHFIVKIKPEAVIEKLIFKHIESYKHNKRLKHYNSLQGINKHKATSFYLTNRWSHFFNSYTQAFNKLNNRKGSLFMRNYKRKKIGDEQYLRKLIHYVHHNPLSAGLVTRLEDWKFSSYYTFLSHKPSNLMRKEVIEIFDGIENFKFCHQTPPELTGIDKYI